MNNKQFPALLLIAIVSACVAFPIVNADTLVKDDFKLESFSKTVDFMDYARAYANASGLMPPPDDYHAYLYMNYINTSGLQLFYAGLDNITFGGPATFTIPMQSFIMHYKTNNDSRDALLASTFLMLLAFNETSNSIYPNSPDVNDTLWASFSMGIDLSSLGATLPALNSKIETIPLSHSDDKLQWSWGMTYTNLTALWWRTWIDPDDPHFDNSSPVAITVYDELSFTYNLTINPTDHTATLTENHIIGRISNLFLRYAPLVWIHYNSTGSYWLGLKGTDTVYDFIENNGIKMSIVDYQTSIVADHETYSETSSGQNVTDTDTSITNSTISTYTDDGEKISEANFGAKNTYKLFNYTADPTEQTYTINEATARTAKAAGFAGNTGLFAFQIGLMKFLPLIVAHMYPGLYARAVDTITNMTRANYFYIIGYGNYSGFRIEHDPTLTVYLSTPTTETSTPVNIGGIIIVGIIVVAIAFGAAIAIRRRKPKTAIGQPTQQQQS
ncbi:MAG TPA: hypothetical protein VEH86_01400 [Candidatus Acidoferrum sp.]|nr:hypothetical protein [Candidatus Acidoferrum sp.]